MNAILDSFGSALWAILVESSLWLLFGLLIAGITHAFIPNGWLEHHLGGRGLLPIAKASALGVPLPLCSCSVIPVAAGLRRNGASRGAVAAFAISTPQTGEESIPLTWALFGPFFAITRPIVAVTTACIAGILIDQLTPREDQRIADNSPRDRVAENDAQANCCSSQPKATSCCCAAEPAHVQTGLSPAPIQRLKTALRYGFGTMLVDLAPWLATGLVLAAVVSAAAPERWMMGALGGGVAPLILAALVGLPLYICATSSTPLAATLVAAGLSPGAALVLLLAGPATNLATMAWVVKDLGVRALAIYLAVIFTCAIGAGLIVDRFFRSMVTPADLDAHEHTVASIDGLAAVAFVVLLTVALGLRLRRKLSQRHAPSDAPAKT